MGLQEQILDLLSENPGLSDREITNILRGEDAAQQPINSSCRNLERKGLIKRQGRPDGRIGNYLTNQDIGDIKAEKRISPAGLAGSPEGLEMDRQSSVIMPKITEIIDQYEQTWSSELQESRKKIDELKAENQILQEELDLVSESVEEILDEELRERLSYFDTPFSDVLIREAGVQLEERLRKKGKLDGSYYGTNLVDALFKPKSGAIVVSKHYGEQEGVQMLYRGAIQFIRNPPMHRNIKYRDSTAQVLIRLIDSLLVLLTELESETEGDVTLNNIRLMLTRRRIPKGQEELYEALYNAGSEGLSKSEIERTMGRAPDQIAGVLGALGRRINHTEGLENKGGIDVVFEIKKVHHEWRYKMRPILRKALEMEGII